MICRSALRSTIANVQAIRSVVLVQPSIAMNSSRPHFRRRPRRPNGTNNASTAAAFAPQDLVLDSMAPTPVEVSRAPSPSNTFSTTRFADLVTQGKISPTIAGNIKHEFCTAVQAATIDACLSGTDVLARAKTGTGKTLAFLLPSIEQLSRTPLPHPNKISILVISPTRELAQQIANEAEVLTASLPYKVHTVVGGTNIASERHRLSKQRCDILVATPGRFLDHIQTSGLGAQLSQVRTLVLDEADRLLDAGFRKDLVSIIDSLPDRRRTPRQALLFSATVSEEVKKIVSLALLPLPQHQYISTISETEQNTHEHVKQEYIVSPLSDSFAVTAKFLFDCIADSKAKGEEEKMMVFLPTARAAGLMYELFSTLRPSLPVPILQIHSRMSQPARTKATESFRTLPSAILFSSDVTARGMDFSGIGWVIQVGIPANGEQYIHRLGRTARAGREGAGLLILTQPETFFLRKREIKELPLVESPQSQSILGPNLDVWREKTADAMSRVANESKAKAYSAWLGYYKGFIGKQAFGWTPQQLVATANEYALQVLLYDDPQGKPPGLLAKTVGMMGLRGTPGLNVVKTLQGGDGSIGVRGGPQGGGGRGGGVRRKPQPGGGR